MSQLKMSIDNINNLMKFNCRGSWNNLINTNCYAYALGIDIPEDKIFNNAYQPGTIGSIIFNIQSNDLSKMSLEEKLYIDFKALNISYDDCSEFIYNPKECKIIDYEYIKCIKLNCKIK